MVLVVCFVLLFLAEIDPAISSSSSLFRQQNHEKLNEEIPEALQISNRKGKFLGRLAFLMDLGNKATPSSYIKKSNENFISRWSPYFAAVYEPFPFNAQSFIPTDILQIWGPAETPKNPPNATEDDFGVFRGVDREDNSTNISMALEGGNLSKEPDVEIISNITSDENFMPKEELLFANEDHENKTMTAEPTTNNKTHTVPQKPHKENHKPATTKPKPETTTMEVETMKPSEKEPTTHKTEITSTTTTHSAITATTPETTNNSNSNDSNFHGYYGGFPQQVDNIYLTTSSSFQDHLYFNSQGQRDNINNVYDNNYVNNNYDSYGNENPPRYGDIENVQDYFEPEIIDLNGFKPNFVH